MKTVYMFLFAFPFFFFYCLKVQKVTNRLRYHSQRKKPQNFRTFVPFSAFQMWTLPSVEPEMTNCESGEKDASRGMFLELMWPVKVCKW